MFMTRLYATQFAEKGLERGSPTFQGIRMTEERSNELAISDYIIKSQLGELPVQIRTKNKDLAPLAVESYSQRRRIDDSLVDLLDLAAPGYRKHTNEWYPGLISMNEDDLTVNVLLTQKDFIIAKTTRIRFGKYLVKTGLYTQDEANVLANKLKSAVRVSKAVRISWADNEESIQAVYEYGPHSCMAGSEDDFEGGVHPACVYDTDDIRIAYVLLGGRIVARAVCNEIEAKYSVIYGNSALLEPLLEDAGYASGSLHGCRIQKIEANSYCGGYIMPYIDGAESVSDEGFYFVIDNGGEYGCTDTEGVTNDRGVQCEYCCEHSHEDDMYWINECNYCSGECAEADGNVMCVDTDEWLNASSAYQCVSDDEYYASCDELILLEDEWYHVNDDSVVYSEYGNEYYHKHDCTYLDCVEDWIPDEDVDEVRADNEEPEEEDEDEATQTFEVCSESTKTFVRQWREGHHRIHYPNDNQLGLPLDTGP